MGASGAGPAAARRAVIHRQWVMACLQLRRHDWDAAEATLRELEDDPSRSALAHGMLAFALEMQGKTDEALRYYRVAIESGDTTDTLLYHHGSVAYRSGHYDESVASWSELLRRHPDNSALTTSIAYAHYEKGRRLIRDEDFEAAIEQLEACEESLTAIALNDAIAELHLHAAAHGADQERAWRHVIAASARRPDDPRVLHRLALREYAVGAHGRAARLWTRAKREIPDDVRIRHGLAVCRIKAGEPEEAARELTELYELEPGERIALASAASHIHAGRWDEAHTLLLSHADDPRVNSLLPESEYRSGHPVDENSGLWHAAHRWRTKGVERGEDAHEIVRRASDDPSDRIRRELALLLRRAALAEADDDWSRAAELFELSDQLTEVRTGFARFHAVVLALGHRTAAAVRTLDAATRREPADHRLSHTLALILLEALRAESDVPPNVTWERCVAAWGAILHDEEFWKYRLSEAEGRYGEPVPPALLSSLPGELQRHLESLLPPEEQDGRQTATALSLLQRETQAAQALAAAGGLPIAHDTGQRPSLVCGPLRLVELGMPDRLATLLTDNDDADRHRLSLLFSQLGFAQSRLAAGTVREAISAALDLRCPSCQNQKPQQPDAIRRPTLCADECQEFGALNPAYAALQDGPARLSTDARALVMDGWLRLGRDALTAAEPDVRRGVDHLRTAIVLSMELGRYRETQQAVVAMALGRAEGLRRSRRLDDAVAVLETAHAMIGANHREPLEGRLSAALTDRAVAAVSPSAERLDSPARDLRRAVRLNPYLLRARVSLGAVLRMAAHRSRFAGSVQGARRSLREAETGLAEALALWPDEPALTGLRDRVADDLAYLADLVGDADDGR